MRPGRYVRVAFKNVDISGKLTKDRILARAVVWNWTEMIVANHFNLDSPLCQNDALLIHDGTSAAFPVLKTICGKHSKDIEVSATAKNNLRFMRRG